MPKFRKKPVVVEAFQMTKKRRHDVTEWPDWLRRAWVQSAEGVGGLFVANDDPEQDRLCISTLEGICRVGWGDFIVQGVAGELYPCKPDIFEATYEPIQSEAESNDE